MLETVEERLDRKTKKYLLENYEEVEVHTFFKPNSDVKIENFCSLELPRGFTMSCCYVPELN